MEITAPTQAIADAAQFFAEALQIDKCTAELEIHFIELDCDEDEIACSTSGWIVYADNVADIYIRENYADPQESQLEILAHEMVHLKQYMKGELVDIPGTNAVSWKGVRFSCSNNPESWTYWDSPWEMEAFGRQHGLNYMRQVQNV